MSEDTIADSSAPVEEEQTETETQDTCEAEAVPVETEAKTEEMRRPPASILAAISSTGPKKLRKTKTKVRTRDGKIHEEQRTDIGIVSEFKGKEILPSFLTEIARKSLRVYEFQSDDAASGSRRSGRWMSKKKKPIIEGKKASVALSKLKVVSYNVWFADFNWESRLAELLRILKAETPDIVCLQEVTPRFCAVFCRDEFICEKYHLSDNSTGITVTPYGVLIAADKRKCPMQQACVCSLPSNMGRRLLCAELRLTVVGEGSDEEKADSSATGMLKAATGSMQSLWVATVHLESLMNANYRIEQLKLIFGEYLTEDNVLFMGDTNFTDGRLENDHIPDTFTDCWVEFAKRKRKRARDGFTGWGCRYDKMYYKTTGFQTATAEFKKLGKVRNPSDHLGICSVLTVSSTRGST